MFCTRASSKNFDKVNKSSNRPLDRDQHSIHYIPRRYVANEEDVTVILMSSDKFIFLLQHFGFVINLKKSVLHPVKKNSVSGLNNRYRKNESGSFREKKCVWTLSGDFHTAKNFSLKSDEDNWPVVINCPDHFTSTIPVSISSTGANIRSCDTGKFSHGGTPLVDEDLETLQWEENSASPKPELHTAREFWKGRKWSKEVKHFHINVLELSALKFAILTFIKNLSHLTIHIQVDNKVALAYLLKMVVPAIHSF